MPLEQGHDDSATCQCGPEVEGVIGSDATFACWHRDPQGNRIGSRSPSGARGVTQISAENKD